MKTLQRNAYLDDNNNFIHAKYSTTALKFTTSRELLLELNVDVSEFMCA